MRQIYRRNVDYLAEHGPSSIKSDSDRPHGVLVKAWSDSVHVEPVVRAKLCLADP
jgi:hypothetical protein